MALTIVGGVYRERVLFPPVDWIFGSGGRAAYALKNLDADICLHSFIGEDQRAAVEHEVNKVWQVDFHGYSVPEIVTFSYYHGMARPVIRPTRLPMSNAQKIEAEASAVLQYGTLEGVSQVHGDRVVYDPQNPESPEKFDSNGSTAEKLAYVLNSGEAQRLTGEKTPENAAESLFDSPAVEVVIIKSGAHGAWVYTRTNKALIPAYETPRVWPIGSGDVFAAVFAYFWASEGRDPVEAAGLASKGTALYCDKRELPLDVDSLASEPFIYPALIPHRKPSDATIYLAGPFFSMGQFWLIEEARNTLLSAGFKVFSPYHDVGLGEADQVVDKDIDGLKEANAVFALCDGLDAGTLFEVGYAVRDGVAVVAFGEQTSNESMKMLRGTQCKVYKDFTTAIYHAQWEALK